MEKKRVDYLDLYKGFAIFLILIHHVFQYFPALSGVVSYVTDFHVACFFLASGWVRYLTKDKPMVSYKEFVIKKVRRLLVPYSVLLPVGYMLLAYTVSQKMENKNVIRRVLNYYGLNSIIVLCVHPTILLCFTYPFGGRLSGLSIGMQCGLAVAVWVIILLICVPCIKIINRWLGFLIGKA